MITSDWLAKRIVLLLLPVPATATPYNHNHNHNNSNHNNATTTTAAAAEASDHTCHTASLFTSQSSPQHQWVRYSKALQLWLDSYHHSPLHCCGATRPLFTDSFDKTWRRVYEMFFLVNGGQHDDKGQGQGQGLHECPCHGLVPYAGTAQH